MWRSHLGRLSAAHQRSLPPHHPRRPPLRRLLRRNPGKNLKEILIYPRRSVYIRGVFYRTSKLTAVPAYTFCPATGTCDTTMLAGPGCGGNIVGAAGFPKFSGSCAGGLTEGAKLTFPSRNPASCKLRFA